MVQILKFDGNCLEINEAFEYLGCFWYGCPFMLNRDQPIGNSDETLLSRYEETKVKQQKSEVHVIMLLRSGVASLETYCAKLQALKINLVPKAI
jgi:hypothetical protein